MGLKDKFIVRASIGFGVGILLGVVITGLTGDMDQDHICYCSPAFVKAVGNELAAFAVQALVFGTYGAVGMGGSVAYSIEDRSLLKVTVAHFVLTLGMFYAMAFFLRWITITDIDQIVVLFGLFAILYGSVWLGNYLMYKMQISEINKKLKVFKMSGSQDIIDK